MNKNIFFSFLIGLTLQFSALSLSYACQDHAHDEDYAQASKARWGGPITIMEISDLNSLLAEGEASLGKPVLIQASILNVCQKKGCWMEIPTASEPVRVVFKDYSFFVPKDLAGTEVYAQGELEKKTLSVREQRHFLKDAGASRSERRQVNEPKAVYQFVASAVQKI